MKKYFLLIILIAFMVACSDDETTPEIYTFQSVLDFDAGKFPAKIGDTVRYEGVVTINPISQYYDSSVKYDAITEITRENYDSKLQYRVNINFNDITNTTIVYGIKKDNRDISDGNMDVLLWVNSSDLVLAILNECKFYHTYDENEKVENVGYIFKENKVKL